MVPFGHFVHRGSAFTDRFAGAGTAINAQKNDYLGAERANCLMNPIGSLCAAIGIIGRFPCSMFPGLGFEPQIWKRGIWCRTGTATHHTVEGTGKTPYDAYCFTQCSNGCSLGSFRVKIIMSRGGDGRKIRKSNTCLDGGDEGTANNQDIHGRVKEKKPQILKKKF